VLLAALLRLLTTLTLRLARASGSIDQVVDVAEPDYPGRAAVAASEGLPATTSWEPDTTSRAST
jgi:hypothetical protein